MGRFDYLRGNKPRRPEEVPLQEQLLRTYTGDSTYRGTTQRRDQPPSGDVRRGPDTRLPGELSNRSRKRHSGRGKFRKQN